jgi:D-tyrosyl-tRNA(Tyr) deacylase
MRVLIQRVKSARVIVKSHIEAGINSGLLLFVGVSKEDRQEDLEWMAKKIINMRIFEDEDGKMNLDIKQAKGEILSVSQFTLYADTHKGNRPGFNLSASPDMAKDYWVRLNQFLRQNDIVVKEGVFAAHMQVELINDGPVTILLDSQQR